MASNGTHPPAGWHNDPDRTNRLRYWDGHSWTDQYAQPADTPLVSQPPPPNPADRAKPTGPPTATGRPWWRKKRFAAAGAVLVGLVGLTVIAGVAVDPVDQTTDGVDTSSTVDTDALADTVLATAPSTIATTPPVTTPPSPTTITTTSTTTDGPSLSTVVVATVPAPPPTLSPQVARSNEQLAELVVTDPDPARGPYIRDSYDGDGWADDDGDCLSTRHELLATYSSTPIELSASGCSVAAGTWTDPYDGAVYTSPDQVSIDHLIPLSEADRSGAWQWDNASKSRFANDQTPGHLVVVGVDTNQAKADSTPDRWLPPDPTAHCQYAIDWIESKTRYQLNITTSERTALQTAVDTCQPATPVRPFIDTPAPDVVITVPTTTTTTLVAQAGPGIVALTGCDRFSEVVTIANTGGQTISLSGFTLRDNDTNHSVNLDQYGSLEPGQQLRITTGPDAADGPGQVAWKRQNVWNNDGDTAYLTGFGVEQTQRC